MRQRQSNIELLRLTAMMMVLGLHTYSAPDVITLNSLTPRLCIDWFKESACISAVNLFVLISGYFGIKWKLRGICSLLFQLFFIYTGSMIISMLIGNEQVSAMSFIFRMSHGWFSSWWFTVIYIGLYLIAPMLNLFAEKLSKRQLVYFLLVYFAYQTMSQLFAPYSFNGGYSVLSFIGLYLIGRLFSKIDFLSFRWFKSNTLIVVWGGVTLLLTMSTLLFAILENRTGANIGDGLFGMNYNNPIVIVQSIIGFLFFLTINIKSRIINWLACSALSIYLLHLYPGWKHSFIDLGKSFYQYDMFTQYSLQILLIIAVSITAVLIDKVRMACFDKVYSIVERWRNNNHD